MTIRKTKTLLPLIALLGISHAKASPILIDFTDANQWGAAAGQASYTQSYGSLDVTLSATGGAMTFNSHEAPTGGPGSDFMSFDGDGIGIGDDEISWGGQQLLDVTFSSSVTVVGYYLLDFFANDHGVADEQALVSMRTSGGDASLLYDVAYAADAWGFYAREGIEMSGTNGVSFSASIGDHRRNDYALAGLLVEVHPVPEPGTLGLLCAALGFLILTRRRFAVPIAR